MRILATIAATAILSASAALPAAASNNAASDQPALTAAPVTDISAAKKPAKKKSKPKVEYMKAVPTK